MTDKQRLDESRRRFCASLVRQFRTHQDLLSKYCFNGESARVALSCWTEWPFIKNMILPAAQALPRDETDHKQYYVLVKMAFAHEAATKWWMRFAEANGIDSSAIWEESRYCRELIHTPVTHPRQPGAASSSWPDYLGNTRYELPAEIRQAIFAGESLIARLVTLCEAQGMILQGAHRSASHDLLRDAVIALNTQLAAASPGAEGDAADAEYHMLRSRILEVGKCLREAPLPGRLRKRTQATLHWICEYHRFTDLAPPRGDTGDDTELEFDPRFRRLLEYLDGLVTDSQPPAAQPRWDGTRLWYGDQLVRTYRKRAKCQALVLESFQECGWQPEIDDPLDPKGTEDPRDRVQQTVKDLNGRKLAEGAIKFIEFSTNGSGTGFRWRPKDGT